MSPVRNLNIKKEVLLIPGKNKGPKFYNEVNF